VEGTLDNNNFCQPILDALVEEIAVLDNAGYIVQVNRSWAKFSSDNDANLVCGKPFGKNYLDVCRNSHLQNKDEYAKDVLDGLEKIYNGLIESFSLEYPCHSPTKERWFLMRASKIYETNGIVISHVNITDRVLTERENVLLREKERNDLNTKFISKISHEIRTPLTSINLSAEILLKYYKTLDDTSKEKYLQDIPTGCKRVSQILEQFIFINKIDSNKVELSLSSVDLKILIEEVIQELSQFNTNAIMRIQVNGLQEINSNLELDSYLLKQILINLLSNALNFSEKDSIVILEVQNKMHQIIFIVIDSGIGVKENEKLRIFESFYRGSNIGNQNGTGLGLYLVKRSIDIYKGKIEFTSKEMERTEFKVLLPIFPKDGKK
jgi:signal transduction histidine kinase